MSKIAIIGVACRFPGGVDGPSAFWDLLAQGRDAVTSIPDDRFDKGLFLHPHRSVLGRTHTFAAGTLGDVSGFDADFFGISAREAGQMDPQQRLLLEMTWEAMERGGQVPEHIAGTPTAVYVGIAATDYADIRQGNSEHANAYFVLGATLSITANRISYAFDLRGPSMAIDTACSSAMVALHEAVHALRGGRCGMAVVGSMHLLLSPYNFIGFSKATLLAPYGRCRAFDKLANGYVRAEGGGVLLLKPLKDAERDGDPILGIIRGVGINNDGRTKGIALPSSESQADLLRKVYRSAKVKPDDLVYLEAHGTGTAVGDPAEASAIGRALAIRRKSGPLPIGSVKSNIGHLEPAAGMAGVIKALLVLQHHALPPTLHFENPNPDIDFAGLNLAPVQALTPIPEREQAALVGVNSFGFGGANAHVIIEEYRPALRSVRDKERVDIPPLYLSARTKPALRAQAEQMAVALAALDGRGLLDAAWTLGCRRTHHAERLVARGADPVAALRQYGANATSADVTGGMVLSQAAPVGLIFSGNGSQWPGMGAALLEEDPVFRAAVERVDGLVRAGAGWSVIEEMVEKADTGRLDDTQIAQPLLFAVQVGLVESLRARGLLFGAVVGHSVGEVAAAWTAGALSLEQAVRVILGRSDAQGRTRGQGGMAAVALSVEKADALVEMFGGRIEVAAINSPKAVTLSGEAAALQELGDMLKVEGVPYRPLDLDYAFHNKVLDPIQDTLGRALKGLSPAVCREGVTFFSIVTGGALAGDSLDADYWWENMRKPVRFGDCVTAMSEAGIQIFLEVGPNPILQAYVRHTLNELDALGQPQATLMRQNAGDSALDTAIDRLHTLGAELDFTRIFPGRRPVADLPTYPWQRERHWFKTTREARGRFYQCIEAPLLGTRPISDIPMWEALIDTSLFPFLEDHVVGGSVIFPAAGFVEIALEAARIIFKDERADVEYLEIHRPLVLESGRPKIVRSTWTPDDSMFRIESRTHMQDEPWSLHVTARLNDPVHLAPSEPLEPDLEGAASVSAEEHYAFAETLGLAYGPAFRTVRTVTVQDDTAVVELTLPASLGKADEYHLHPALFDGCLQALFNVAQERIANGSEVAAYLPYQIGRFFDHGRDGTPARCFLTLTAASPRSLVADFVITDASGMVLAEARGFRFRRTDLLRRAGERVKLYQNTLRPLPLLISAKPLELPLEAAATAVAQVASETESPLDLSEVAGAFARQALACLNVEERDVETVVPEERRHLLNLCRDLAQCAAPSNLAEAASPETLWRAVLGRHPGHLAELMLIGRAGKQLADALRGPAFVQPAASAAGLEHFFDSSPTLTAGNAALAAAVSGALAARPPHRHLRVLEVGAGTGGLTRRLLDILPPEGVSLTITDADDDALARLAGDIGERPAVTVEPLDVLAPVGTQPASTVRYDIVVAASLLQAVEQPLAALEKLNGLAVPGGLVLLAEPASAAWLNMAFGLSEAWWTRHDNEVPLPPLLDRDTFLEFAGIAGLTQVEAVPVGGAIVLTARRGVDVKAKLSLASAQPDEATTAWVVVAEPNSQEETLAEALTPWLGDVRVLTSKGAVEAARNNPPDGIIFLQGLGESATQTSRCWALTSLVQALEQVPAQSSDKRARLIIVTAGAYAEVAGEAVIWGLGRVIQNEHPGLEARLIDLQADDPLILAEALAAEVLNGNPESEVLLGPDHRYGVRVSPAAQPQPSVIGKRQRMLTFTPGALDSLHWVEGPRRAPGPGEVEIAVRAAGLNFRDVMFALGVLPDEAVENGFAGATIGMEASGIVTRVGADVAGLQVSDKVFCFAPACFSSHLTTAAISVARLPASLDFTAAATVPTVIFTVYYALHHLANLQSGERILIHGGAGGVGLAAIQYARHVGAEVFTTVGAPEKRDLVVLFGVPETHVFDSRSTAFADQVLAATQGQGVDVILNSLAGEAIHKSLSVLRRFGRFLELGKRDFFANSKIGLRPFRNNISYFGIDADQLMAEKPALATRLFGEMVALFEQGVFTPLPHRVFDQNRVVEAFRYMQQSRHVGKIVLIPPQTHENSNAAAPQQALSLNPDAAYMVTGGTTGFGLSTAVWLADKGVRHLVLVSRRGVVGDEAAPAVEDLRTRDIRVDVVACDVADASAVETLVASLGDTLKGIVHAAAVYDDGLLTSMTEERFTNVLAPKAAGAWILHQATAHLSLEVFVVFSSVSAMLGTPGQASYVAANVALDALVEHRRRAGLPALAVQWGPIADVGYLSRHADVRENLADRTGVVAMTASQALDHLEYLLLADVGCAAVAELDWRKLRSGLPVLRTPRFEDIGQTGGGETGVEAEDIQALIEGLTPTEIRDLLVEMLSEEIGHILRLPADRIDTCQTIFDMGMDSLMALELKLVIEEKFGVDLPPMVLSEGGTVLHLAERIRDHLTGQAPVEATDDITVKISQHGAADVDVGEAREILSDLEKGIRPVEQGIMP